MKIVHSQLEVKPKEKQLTKKQQYHLEMEKKLRRYRFKLFQSALKDPEVIAKIKEVQKVSPGWMPRFRK